MNNKRRAQLQEVIDSLRATQDVISVIRDDEQNYYDNMPESIQGSEKGEVAEEAINNMDEAIDGIDSVIDSLEEAKA